MTAVPKNKLTAAEFLSWSERTPGRYELHDGHIVVMQSERVAHLRVKFRLARRLQDAATRGPCEVFPDGMAVRIDDGVVYEPDALLYCGEALPPDTIEIGNPVIVVEVISPSTAAVDRGEKLFNYFRLPSVQHYLIVDPRALPIVHHARQADGTSLTRLVHGGPITMTPPGITIDTDTLLDV
jgi:Uma2 family endonuclease